MKRQGFTGRSGQEKAKADQASPELTNQILRFLQIDLEQVYQEHRSYTNRIQSTLAIVLTIASAPLLVGAALLSSEVVSTDELQSISAAPFVLGLVLIVAGVGNTVPFIFIVDSQVNALYCVRAINHFRGVYVQLMRAGIPGMEHYQPALPVDWHSPRAFKPTGTAGILVVALTLINALYVSSGIIIVSNVAQAMFFPLLLVLWGAEYAVYVLKTRASP